MLRKQLFRGSWSALVAWRRTLQLQRGFLTQSFGIQAICSSTRSTKGTFPNWSAPCLSAGPFARGLHGSPLVCGLEEFFPRKENLIEEGEKTGIVLTYSLWGLGGGYALL